MVPQYATQHIDSQILVLREFIASLHPLPPAVASSSSSSPSSPSRSSSRSSSSFAFTTTTTMAMEEPTVTLTPDHLRTLAHLRSDIVHTIRQVVGVVSKYAGGALPEPARGRVRGFILDLPKRFGKEAAAPSTSSSTSSNSTSSAIGVSGVGGVGVGGGTGTGTAARRGARRERGVESVPASPTGGAGAGVRPLHPHSTAHSHSSHSHSRRGSTQGGSGVEPGKALAAAQRVLTLATESLDMMRGVTAVVGDSLDRADAWVDRLRTVGIQRGMDGLALPEGAPPAHAQSHAHADRRLDITLQGPIKITNPVYLYPDYDATWCPILIHFFTRSPLIEYDTIPTDLVSHPAFPPHPRTRPPICTTRDNAASAATATIHCIPPTDCYVYVYTIRLSFVFLSFRFVSFCRRLYLSPSSPYISTPYISTHAPPHIHSLILFILPLTRCACTYRHACIIVAPTHTPCSPTPPSFVYISFAYYLELKYNTIRPTVYYFIHPSKSY
ncbi:transcription factor Opi1-domain-containing protein [Mycena filopes]|nr:transcription factor Opi1-domain-containing protein [Mycena filopes]